MSLLRPQFTVRRLMAVVVLVAIGFPLIELCQLRERYKREAKRHDQDQLYWTKTMNDSLRVLTTYKSGEIPDKQSLIAGNLAQIERLRKQVEYHSRMKEKYESAALRPWNSMPADPPEPRKR